MAATASSFRRAHSGALRRPRQPALGQGHGLGSRAVVGRVALAARLFSSGLQQLDEALGGGLAAQSVTLLVDESECFRGPVDQIMGYAMAQAVSSGHETVIVQCVPPQHGEEEVQDQEEGTAANPWLERLPYNATLGEADTTDAAAAAASGKSSTRYCHSYDLARPLQKHVLAGNPVRVVSVPADGGAASDSSDDDNSDADAVLARLRAALLGAIGGELHEAEQVTSAKDSLVAPTLPHTQDSLKDNQLRRPVRIFLPDLAGLGDVVDLSRMDICRKVVRVLHEAQAELRKTRLDQAARRCTLMLSVQDRQDGGRHGAWLHNRLRRLSDSVLRAESFAGRLDEVPHEFHALVGLLRLSRLQSTNGLTEHHPASNKFGLRRDRRKLHIELLHLPPEQERFASARATTAANHSVPMKRAARGGGATLPCASTLDF